MKPTTAKLDEQKDTPDESKLPQTITLNWQGQVDGTVEAFRVNGMMAVPEESGVIYVTKEQAAEFFGIDLEAHARMETALKAIMGAHKFNVTALSPAQVHELAFNALNPEPAVELALAAEVSL